MPSVKMYTWFILFIWILAGANGALAENDGASPQEEIQAALNRPVKGVQFALPLSRFGMIKPLWTKLERRREDARGIVTYTFTAGRMWSLSGTLFMATTVEQKAALQKELFSANGGTLLFADDQVRVWRTSDHFEVAARYEAEGITFFSHSAQEELAPCLKWGAIVRTIAPLAAVNAPSDEDLLKDASLFDQLELPLATARPDFSACRSALRKALADTRTLVDEKVRTSGIECSFSIGQDTYTLDMQVHERDQMDFPALMNSTFNDQQVLGETVAQSASERLTRVGYPFYRYHVQRKIAWNHRFDFVADFHSVNLWQVASVQYAVRQLDVTELSVADKIIPYVGCFTTFPLVGHPELFEVRSTDALKGIMAAGGDFLIPLRYEEIDVQPYGFHVQGKKGLWGLYSTGGEQLLPAEYSALVAVGESRVKVSLADGSERIFSIEKKGFIR